METPSCELHRLQLCALVVTQSLSLSENNYSTYQGKTLIFTWKPLNCTLLHIMYTKPEINKWCYSTSQTFLLCLHCAFILLYGICSVGGLHFSQHTVISLLGSFPLFIIEVPHWSTSRLLCPSEESRSKKIQVCERRGQQCSDNGQRISAFQWVNTKFAPFFCLKL